MTFDIEEMLSGELLNPNRKTIMRRPRYNPVKKERNPNKHHGITTKQAIIIGAGAGIISALLPSVPTIVKFWNDDTEVSIFGIKMPYSRFLRYWVTGSAIALFALWYKFRK